jgi:putative ABC transport system permease protein
VAVSNAAAQRARTAYFKVSMADGGTAHEIGVAQVGACGALLLVVSLISWTFNLRISDRLLIAAVRTVVQLFALALVLEPIFDHNTPFVVLPYIGLMIGFATREASVKPSYFYKSMGYDVLLSLVISLSASMIAAVTLLRFTPWLDAQYAIPIAGMILGNSISAVNLALAGYLTALVENTAQMDVWLACGATRFVFSCQFAPSRASFP